ncbi:hypothetical protein MHTCC0001_17200 [Flavobacteriaceae bacterium MHTCC 0001]
MFVISTERGTSDEKSQNNEIPPHTSFGMTTIMNFKCLMYSKSISYKCIYIELTLNKYIYMFDFKNY